MSLAGIVREVFTDPHTRRPAHDSIDALTKTGPWAITQVWLPSAGTTALIPSTVASLADERFVEYRERTLVSESGPGIGLPGAAWSARDVTMLEDASGELGLDRRKALPDGSWSALAIPVFQGRSLIGVVEFVCNRGSMPSDLYVEELQAALLTVLLGMHADQRQQSTDDLRRLFMITTEESSDLAVVFREDGSIIDSTASGKVLGRAGTLRGRNLFEFVHPDAKTTFLRDMASTGHRQAKKVEFAAVQASGMIRTMAGTLRDLRQDPSVRGYVLNMRDVTDETNTRRLLMHDSRHDPLTGLLNRPTAVKSLQAMLDLSAPDGVILCVNLDGFRAVNEVHGHTTADDILRQVGTRLGRACEDGDQLARMNGDEFIVFAADAGNQAGAERRARRIIEALREPFVAGTHDVIVNASIGLALLGRDAGSADQAVWNATVAMHEAKRLRCGYTLFTPSLAVDVRNRQRMEAELRTVVHDGGLSVRYQPVWDIKANRVIGVEALLRWEHPVRGLISPAEFVPVAEQTGSIVEIGRWVLREAIRDASEFDMVLGEDSPDFVSINVSAAQIRTPGFADDVALALDEFGVTPDRIALEITETSLLSDESDPGVVDDALDRLRTLGVRLDIDDFGTGYSSWAYLARLPVHALKIDRTFTWGLMEDGRLTATVEALLGLADRLALKTVAEGVETPEQMEWLRNASCDYAQGFLIGRPMQTADLYPSVRRLNREGLQSHVTGDL
jgi:diguanylate cyclase (GGDEF)-like protein/PAS domain S-box-containing protein